MQKRIKMWMGILMAVILCLSQGCGNRGSSTGQEVEQGSFAVTEGGWSGENSMGRYLEKEITLPKEISAGSNHPVAYLQQLDSGDLVLMEQAAGLYLSSDQGETWIRKPTPWYEELKDQNAYISQISLAPNGAAAVIYDPYEKPSEEVQEVSEGIYVYLPEYLYVDPKGNTEKLEAPNPEQVLNRFWFGRDSWLYGCDMDGNIYAMDPGNHAAEKLFEVEGLSEYVCFAGSYMITFTSRNDVVLYDLEKGMVAEQDQVLGEFVRNNLGSSDRSDINSYRLLAAAGEQENVLYLAYSGGIYRHVLGGSVMEQLLDGSMDSLGDPQMSVYGFSVLPDGEFLILYNEARLYRYVYDPDIPTVPEEQISIYSLTEDSTIRQAVNLFQKQNPELCVRYEIGLMRDGSMTAEDAVKNLNTRLMSGTGPDLLVLDGLPLLSYEEKGILTDLSGIVHDMKHENRLFKNLVDACRSEGRLYYLPVRFRIPMLVGKRESVEQVKDLPSLASAVEELRSTSPKGAVIGLLTEEEVLRTLQMTCSGAWLDPVDGTPDREKLTEFLQSARRIYEAETAGFCEEELEDLREDEAESRQPGSTGEGMVPEAASTNALNVAMETQKFGAGVTYGMDCEFNTISTLASQNEDFAYALWQGQVPGGFLPRSMVGICDGAEEKEPVLKFFRFLYGRELQDLELQSGFPINEASFEKLRENPRAEEMYSSAGIIIVNDGKSRYSLEIFWSPGEDFERLRNMVCSVSAVCTGDALLEQTVCELGIKAVNGNAGVEDTVDEILKRVEIYLAE